MRTLFFAGCLVLSACTTTGTGLARCEPAGGGPICAQLNELFDIRVGEMAVIADTRFALTMTGVPEDSRCPSDVVCVWAGNARVALTLREASDARDRALNTTIEPRSAEHGGYRVTLESLSPTPVSGRAIAQHEYVARLRVTRR